MPKIKLQGDNAVAETLLIPLYARAVEARQPVPLVLDDRAATLVESIDYDFARFRLYGHDQVTIILRLREFDRRAQDFLAHHPQAVVVHIGCGLDTRFERVDNGQVTWYNLDLPQVIALRGQLIRESERCRYLGCSVFEESWLDAVRAHSPRPFLFLAEAVFPYFEETQVKRLFLTLMQHFPGAELVCDAMTPLLVRLNNLQLRSMQVGARLRWGMRHSRDPEGWGQGIRLLINGLTWYVPILKLAGGKGAPSYGEVIRQMVGLMDVRQGLLLDVACGPGTWGRRLASLAMEVFCRFRPH